MSMFAPQTDAPAAIDAFLQAAALNREDPFRQGGIIALPGYGQCVMTGDLHGNRKNFDKLTHYAMLDRASARHVILHELVHAELNTRELDRSHELALAAARYKCQFPEQVHFLQSNHELAQLTGYPIAKNGRAVIDEFNRSVAAAYGDARATDVLSALNEFIASFALAVRTENRVWMTHSLPNAHDMADFDYSIFERAPTREALASDRSIFNLVWGRRHSHEQLDALAAKLDVDVFMTGHQPQEMGYVLLFDRLIILASEHNHGSFLPFDLSRPLSADALIRNIRKFVAIV
ncbi:hypothetical protein RAS2_13990 [Phycisphaerae bacterium RAS2]|nr:hypothetical protein RAS2_13990 [Phycisphaerae bacterium RAS2]